mmetsp:Transcript_14744/g.41237  ORF Transcript_14744/g.41237 Transcript_14744/m.41237 type:complete len:96 (-) Transcript_14744:980-1267(-)
MYRDASSCLDDSLHSLSDSSAQHVHNRSFYRYPHLLCRLNDIPIPLPSCGQHDCIALGAARRSAIRIRQEEDTVDHEEALHCKTFGNFKASRGAG